MWSIKVFITLNNGSVKAACDTDIYFRNVIFSNISEIIFMCITDYFKLLSRTCAIKTLKLKFLTESKIKKQFVQLKREKMIDELEIAYQLVHLWDLLKFLSLGKFGKNKSG